MCIRDSNQGLNQILITSNWLPNVVPPDVPTPGPGTDETPVPTYDVNLKKISAADGNKVIQGAKFKLHNDSLNQWYVWNTSSNQWTCLLYTSCASGGFCPIG